MQPAAVYTFVLVVIALSVGRNKPRAISPVLAVATAAVAATAATAIKTTASSNGFMAICAAVFHFSSFLLSVYISGAWRSFLAIRDWPLHAYFSAFCRIDADSEGACALGFLLQSKFP